MSTFTLLLLLTLSFLLFFFFNDPPTTEIYTLSLHDALPISRRRCSPRGAGRYARRHRSPPRARHRRARTAPRSEEHTSELQSHSDLVCRLLLEKKKKKKKKKKSKKKIAAERQYITNNWPTSI